MTTRTMTAGPIEAGAEDLRIEFLFLDLTRCLRCRGTDQSLDTALELTREVLAASGVRATVDKIHVTSAELARELRFVSSPTLRVNGRDVALELRESPCGSEACTDGCGDHIACRVWVYRGQEYTEPPVAMIVEAILRQVYGGTAVADPASTQPYVLPENLERFYRGKSAADPQGDACCAPAEQEACCAPAEQEACCEPDDKAECCGTGPGEATGSRCGCR